jgi:hypothetical protein
MARIHGTAGSTKYLLKRTRPVNGKPMESLGELQHFLSHYEEILAKAEAAAARKQDECILALKNDEARLARELEVGLARRTAEVDRE